MELGSIFKREWHDRPRSTDRHLRALRRERRHVVYAAVGMNGDRALDRRLRQISSGQLRPQNGLAS